MHAHRGSLSPYGACRYAGREDFRHVVAAFDCVLALSARVDALLGISRRTPLDTEAKYQHRFYA